ncbi:MAG: hypothetical protein CL878_13475 [Dehalococcoidia bacterium]|nr:hypothetical protein [Dehalococcoidia bacterium]
MTEALAAETILQALTPGRESVDRFLSPENPNGTVFDPELGFLLRTSVRRDGMDGSRTYGRYEQSGERRMLNFAELPCRINTYGNSFTQGAQVSDGETYEEYLAAHLGEPLRNFGVRGHGVYQAYRRMLRVESASVSANYLILNIYGDDHYRSIYPWRWLHLRSLRRRLTKGGRGSAAPSTFHANPWVHLRLNPETGAFDERPNPYPTPESLYQLCDPQHVYDTFHTAFDVQALLARHHAADVNHQVLQAVADSLDQPTDFSSSAAVAQTAGDLLLACALRASQYVVEQARAFAAAQGKRLLLLLSFSEAEVHAALTGQPRFDQPFVDYLQSEDYHFVDSLPAHVEDYTAFQCSPEEYLRRYYIGHYNPRGNHFFAFAIKEAVVDWLDPKPPAYADESRNTA